MQITSTLSGRVKNLLPKRLFPRALLIIVLPILIVQIVLTWAFYERHWQSVSRHMMRGVVGEVEATLTDLNAAKSRAEQDEIANRARRFFSLNVSQYPDKTLSRQIDPAEPDFDALTSTETLLARNINRMMTTPYDVRYSRPTRQFLIEVARDQGILRFAIADKRIITETTEIFLIWMVGTSLVVVIIAILFLRNQIRPIRALAEAAELFGKGREAKNFRPTGALEVRRAAIALIEMKNRLRRQIGDRTEMLAGVSHDLRAPLTRMKLEVAMLGDGDASQALNEDILEMEHMIEGYLAFARGEGREEPVMTDLRELLADVAAIDARPGHVLGLSIDLGGMLVLAGDEAGLAAFEADHPVTDGRFPMRLANHAGFHTALQDPVAQAGRQQLPAAMFGQPDVPLIDGRGAVWWPGACDTGALWGYTLGHQVVRPYDFTRAIATAAREFAPDLFIVTGPGDTLGGAVAQSLVLANWRGMADKSDFNRLQADGPLLAAMGRPDQRSVLIPT